MITKTTATYDEFSHALHASVMKVHLALGNPVCVIFQYWDMECLTNKRRFLNLLVQKICFQKLANHFPKILSDYTQIFRN